MRLVRKDKPRRHAPKQQCIFCGSFWGDYGEKGCPKTTCLFCGSTICMSHGLGRGQCPVCLHGLLPGWSGNDGKCTYKHCGKPVVACGRGRKLICRDHAVHQKLNPSPDLSDWVEVQE